MNIYNSGFAEPAVGLLIDRHSLMMRRSTTDMPANRRYEGRALHTLPRRCSGGGWKLCLRGCRPRCVRWESPPSQSSLQTGMLLWRKYETKSILEKEKVVWKPKNVSRVRKYYENRSVWEKEKAVWKNKRIWENERVLWKRISMRERKSGLTKTKRKWENQWERIMKRNQYEGKKKRFEKTKQYERMREYYENKSVWEKEKVVWNQISMRERESGIMKTK